MTKRSRKRRLRPKAVTREGNRSLWVAGIAFVAVIVLAIRLMTPQGHEDGDLRAALIDQFTPAFPNEEFRSSAMSDIGRFGLPVDVYEGEEIDVDFYRSLGEEPYGVLVIRSHSGIVLEGSEDEGIAALFTNELYHRSRHTVDQLHDRVFKVKPFEGEVETTFGVGPDFFRHSMRGDFHNAVVVISGCSILYRTELAEALVARGASVVISWDVSIRLDHMDRGTGLLLHYLLGEGMTVEEAVSAAMAECGPDPEFGAVLKYYPPSAGRYTAAELLRG